MQEILEVYLWRVTLRRDQLAWQVIAPFKKLVISTEGSLEPKWRDYVGEYEAWTKRLTISLDPSINSG